MANVLAGEAAANDVNSSCGKSVGCERSDVIVNRDSRPMLRQHAPAEWINLAERDRLETASALEAKAEPANAAEEVEDAHHRFIASSASISRASWVQTTWGVCCAPNHSNHEITSPIVREPMSRV